MLRAPRHNRFNKDSTLCGQVTPYVVLQFRLKYLVQVLTKPISAPMLAYGQLEPQEQNSVKLFSKLKLIY